LEVIINQCSFSCSHSLFNLEQYMLHRLIGHQYDYGRLYNHTCISNIVARVCGRHAYVIPDEVEEGGKLYQLADCLVDFTPDKWKTVIGQFQRLRESMLRNDASLIVLPSKLDDDNERLGDADETLPESDDEINEELESHTDFSKKYIKMLDLMKFHMCLSHLQPQLETAIQGAESVVIPHDNIIAFDSAIKIQFGDAEDSKHARILNNLFEVNNKNNGTRFEGLHLKSFSEIEKIYAARREFFDLEGFQSKFLQLIRRWTNLVLPVPELSTFNYGSTKASDGVTRKPMAMLHEKENMPAPGADISKSPSSFEASTSGRQQQRKHQKRRDDRKLPPADIATSFENEVDDDIEPSSEDEMEEKMGARDDLKRKTKALMENVKDPLNNCVAIAQSARARQKVDESENEDSSNDGNKAVKTPTFRKPQKSAHQLTFSDDSEGEDIALSDLPAQYKPSKPRDIHVSSKFSTTKKRRRFTEVEDEAIRKGVKLYGVGKWSDIKAHYDMELRDRTTVQIKDRWRTVTK